MTAEIIDHPGMRSTNELKTQRLPAARFWMKFNIPTFLAKTAAMDTTAIGALVLLEGYYFLRGELPKTDQDRARVCKLSGKKFASYRTQLLSFFDDEGRSAELDASIDEIDRISSSRRDAGRKGGASKSQAIAKQEPEQKAPKIQIESQIQKELQEPRESESSSPPAPPPSSESPAREKAVCQLGQEIAAEVLVSLPITARAHPGWRGLGAWIDRLLSDGVERVDIVVGITQCLSSLKDQPPSTFGYFTAAIERARATRAASLLQVTRPQPAHHDLGDCGDTLRQRLGNDVFAAWFEGSKLLSISGDTVMISVPTKLKQSRIIANYQTDCIKAFKADHPSVQMLNVTVEAER